MKAKDIDLVKIIDHVWQENNLHSGTYKVATLLAMQKLQFIYENRLLHEKKRNRFYRAVKYFFYKIYKCSTER